VTLAERLKTAYRALFEGARFSTTRSIVIESGPRDARFDADNSTRLELVRKARYFEKNNAIVNRMADIFETYVVGAGLQIQHVSQDEDWNAAAKVWWNGWERFPDIRSLQDFGTLQSLIARTWFVDGECFIRKVRGQSGRPRLLVMEGHAIETPPDERENPQVIDGIRVDSNGRPISYYVKHRKGRNEFAYELVPAEQIIHVFEPSRPGQYRGLPFIYPVINTLHDLTDLQSLEMQAAKDAASRTNVIKVQGGSLDLTQLRQSRFTASQSMNTGATATESRAEYYRDVTGSAPIVLQPGDDFQQFKSDRPSVVTREYWRYLSELACTGCGFPLVLVFPDSMQGTVYRGSLDMAAVFFRSRFQVMASALREVHAYVMGWAANGGESALSAKPEDWANIEIHPPRAVNVDVGRNSAATIAELEANLTTQAAECGKQGLDWRAVLRQRASEHEYAKQLGLEKEAINEPMVQDNE